jgi:hypothetical protein
MPINFLDHPTVVAVIQDRLHKVHTTHSWGFLGLETYGGNATDSWNAGKFGEGVVIGNVDSGT